MDKKTLLAPAIIAAALLTACGAEDPVGAPPPAPVAAVPEAAAGATVPVAAYSLPPDAPSAGHCALDMINGGTPHGATLPASGSALFGGWVANAALEVPADALFVLRGDPGSFAAALTAGTTDRPDVAQALGSAALVRAGFNLKLALDGIPAGSYELLAMVDATTQATCSFNTTLVLQ